MLGLYNRAITIDTFLATAHSAVGLRQLGRLLGYEPRPAVGTNDGIAAFISKPSFLGPRMTSYRATLSNSLDAQVFEAIGAPNANFKINEFTLSPLRDEGIGSLALRVEQRVVRRTYQRAAGPSAAPDTRGWPLAASRGYWPSIGVAAPIIERTLPAREISIQFRHSWSKSATQRPLPSAL